MTTDIRTPTQNRPRVLRVAVAQTPGRLNATAENAAEVCRLSTEAADQGAKLILFPEGCVNGNSLAGAEQQARMPADEKAFSDLSHTARERGIAICAGFTTPFGEYLNNAFVIALSNGRVLFQYKAARSKTEPPFLGAWPDVARTVFEVDGVRIILSICSEYGVARVEEAVRQANPDLILHPSAGCMSEKFLVRDGQPVSAETEAYVSASRQLVETASLEVARRGIPKVSANLIGFDGKTWWPGNSYAIGADGKILLWLPVETHVSRMKPSVAVGDIPIPAVAPQTPP